jgi:hypothetical protein
MQGRRGLVVAATLLVAMMATPAAIAGNAALEDPKILGVDEDEEQASLLFAAPPGLATRTLTEDDVAMQVDGASQPARVRRLSASDLEIALVIDTTVATGELRALQAALVEFALTLPQGAAMRIVDATGTVSETAPVPGPAIAAIRALRPTSGSDDMTAAVGQAMRVLDDSSRGRTALLVVGGDLANRIDVVDDRSLQSLSYLITIGSDQAGLQLGPRAPGEVVTVDAPTSVLAAIDDIARDLRMLYLAQVEVPEGGAQTITFAITAEEGATRATTLEVDAGAVRPTVVQPDAVEQPDGGQAAQPDPDRQPNADRRPAAGGQQAPAGDTEWDQWWLVLIGAAAVVMAVLALRALLFRRPATSLPAPLPPLPPAQFDGPQRRRATQSAARPQRPIVKLSPETREALARAHRGLRQLALASRETASIVPDDLFRLAEARASAALSGYDRPLDATLYTAVSDDTERGSVVVHRAAKALSAGWQHTTRQRAAPPAVVEMNALLSGNSSSSASNRRKAVPVAPVRALNPLVEIGVEHMVLAAQPEEYAALAARAVTAVDIMRAARLARPVLAISPFLLTDIERYRAACRADPTDAIARDAWLQFLCDGIAERSYVAIDQLRRMHLLRARYRDAARTKLSMRLLDLLLAQPVVATPLIAKRLAVSSDAAESVTEMARDAGWLAPHPLDPNEDVWLASEVLDVFTDVG